jgi:antitoxin (DNA-binding transcriptional repressor) of toxin-antitoxin stability system
MAFASFTVPRHGILCAFVIPHMANLFTMAAAVATVWMGVTDEDDAPVKEVRRYHA